MPFCYICTYNLLEYQNQNTIINGNFNDKNYFICLFSKSDLRSQSKTNHSQNDDEKTRP